MATRKPAVPVDEKFEKQDFDLFEALAAIDKKDYDYYDRLTEEQQRKFVAYMMIHWASAIKGSSELQQYYLQSIEYHTNKYYFNEYVKISKKFFFDSYIPPPHSHNSLPHFSQLFFSSPISSGVSSPLST